MASEDFPDFFARVPTITVRDKLAEFLGAAVHGTFFFKQKTAYEITV